MGLFDFLKPKKESMAELLKKPAMQGVMVGMELEYLQKQVANMKSVGRIEDAKKAVNDFLVKYVKESGPGLVPRDDLARISYSLAYRTLPELVHFRWSEFHDLWTGGIPFPIYLAIKGASDKGKRLNAEQIKEFRYYQGNLRDKINYYLIEFPTPPDQGEQPSLEALVAQIARDKEQGLNTTPVLGPFFGAAINDEVSNTKHFYILGQSPGGGTTLRFVAAGGMNANCGPGPEPSANQFLKAIAKHLQK